MEITELLHIAINASIKAGNEIERIYNSNFSIEYKEDKSPLTEADKAANKVIVKHLLTTEIPILSEEGKSIDYNERKNWSLFWLVDPLDGTKEFIKKNGEFTVNIALIRNGLPIMGVVYAPILKKIYFGARRIGSYLLSGNEIYDSFKEIKSKSIQLPIKEVNGKYFVLASRSHLSKETESFVNNLKKAHSNLEYKSIGSSLKFCMIAHGDAHIYPRLAPTMEWDTAAGHAVLKFAGGNVWQVESGIEVTYNKENLLNPWFVAEMK